jgi:DNA topoisomerase-1
MGHVRDLPRKEMGVDVEKAFRPHYVTAAGKRKTVDRLKEAARDVQALYLATDPDREGEAIAWHVLQVIRRSLPKGTPVFRVTFHEITRGAVHTAFDRATALNQELIEAQQTRRILDRLVGYSISPMLWKRIRGLGKKARGLSAGRVQTIALRLVVDREREIEAFEPVEYWSIEALLAQQAGSIDPATEPTPFIAQLWRIYDAEGRPQKPDLKNRDDTQAIVDVLEDALYWVDTVKTERKPRYPWPPFTTSTMQQAASKALGFAPAFTMRVAQQLYEGIRLGEEGTVGLITYMRTDSTHVAPEAQAAAREVIAHYWGEGYLPNRAPTYKTRVKSAQEAHEAIRPTDPHRTPKQMREFLDKQQARLYELIWRRFIASQMKPALYDVTTAIIPTAKERREEPLPYLFRAQGRVCVFDGFLKVYEEQKETIPNQDPEADDENALPPLTTGEWLDLLDLIAKQHWTKPPPRYTEASLIKELERRGIGRPSTFASIVDVIKKRVYVRHEGKVLAPTDLGFAVCDLLVDAFVELFDYEFTAQMEDKLDHIANGQAQRAPTLDEFWRDLSVALGQAEAQMPHVQLKRDPPKPTGEKCPECGGDLIQREGRYGKFVGCANYPKCKYIQRRKPRRTGQKCPTCGGDLVIRNGRAVGGKRRPFIGCSNYPSCTYTAQVTKETEK